MPKYQVRISELALYVDALDAADEESAKAAALETFIRSEDVNQFFDCVDERGIDAIVEVDEAGAPVAEVA